MAGDWSIIMEMFRNFSIIFVIVFLLAGTAAYLMGFGRNAEVRQAKVLIGGHHFQAEIADTMASRAQGLSGRESLPRDAAMLFIFDQPAEQGFWMKNMNFPLDILWLSGDRLVGIAKNVQPEPGVSVFALKVYRSPEPVDRVLEINAGLSEEYGFKPGDRMELVL